MSPSNQDDTSEVGVVLPLVEQVILTARAQLGKPYQIGTEGPNKFDCSGLVYYAFNQNSAANLIGGARHRANWYKQWFIEQGQFSDGFNLVSRGDLIIYGEPDKRATHIGIYLGGRRTRLISALVNPWGVTITRAMALNEAIQGVCHVEYSDI